MEEVWKSIIDFSGYEISNFGQVKNVISGIILKPKVNKDGYLTVKLCKNGIGKFFFIHRLVGIHFIDNNDDKPYIDHINRVRTDNRFENLRWVTILENNQNRSINKNNKLNEQFISKDRDYFVFSKNINGKNHKKGFKTLEEAKTYRDNFLANL